MQARRGASLRDWVILLASLAVCVLGGAWLVLSSMSGGPEAARQPLTVESSPLPPLPPVSDLGRPAGRTDLDPAHPRPVAMRTATVPWRRSESRPRGPLFISTAGLMPGIVPALESQRQKEEAARGEAAYDEIRLSGDFECGYLPKVKRLSNTHFVLDFEGKFCNWFMFKVEGAKGKTLRIDLQNVFLEKWWSLNPVYSYVEDLSDPASFESVLPPDVAPPQFATNGPLLPDTRGQKWHYMANVWQETEQKSLCLVQTFEQDRVYVAMRTPYTLDYNGRLVASLQGRSGVQAIEVGRSRDNRPLHVIKVSSGDQAERTRPCVLLYAREHGTEPDSSFVVEGALRFLLSETPEAKAAREQATFLLIPVVDPDAALACVYDTGICYQFNQSKAPVEALAYTAWFEGWIEAGKRLDVALDLHNVESSELEHFCCMYGEPQRLESCKELHRCIVAQLTRGGAYRVRQEIGSGYIVRRLGGWLGSSFGPLPMLYELNSQDRSRHLAIDELRDMGRLVVQGASDYLYSAEGKVMMAFIDRVRVARAERLAQVGRGANAIATGSRLGWVTPSVWQKEKKETSP